MSSSSADSYGNDEAHHSKDTSPAPAVYETDSSDASSAGKEYLQENAHASSPEIEVPHEGSTHYLTDAIALGTYSAFDEVVEHQPVQRYDVPPLKDGDICSASSTLPASPETDHDSEPGPQRLPHLVASPEKRGAPPALTNFSSPIKQSTAPNKTVAGKKLDPLSPPAISEPYQTSSRTPTKPPVDPLRGSVVTPINSPSKWVATANLMSFDSSRSPMAVAKRDQVPMEQSMSSYNRNYKLTNGETPHKRVSQDLMVSRSFSSAKKPDWGSNMKAKQPVTKEALGNIELSPKTKYDYLSEGQQLIYVDMAEHPRRRSSQVVFAEPGLPAIGKQKKQEEQEDEDEEEPELAVVTRKQRSAPSSATGGGGGGGSGTLASPTAPPKIRSIRRLFEIVDFAKAKADHEASNTDDENYGKAMKLFEVLSNNKEKILVEDLHDLLVQFTTPGASAREASDFLWEECDRKIALTLPDFLQYGPKLKTRVFSYENFTTFTDDEKFIHIHARLFPYKPLEKSGTSARKQILKAEKHLRQNPSTSPFRPLRVYEYEFLLNYQKRLLVQGLISADEVPPENFTGRAATESPTTTRLRRSLTGTSTSGTPQQQRQASGEQPDWGGGGSSSAGKGNTSSALVSRDAGTGGDDDAAYPTLAKCNAQTPEAKRKRQQQQQRQHNSTNNTPSSSMQHSTKQSGGVRGANSSRKLFPGSASPSKSNTRTRTRSKKSASRRTGSSSTRKVERPPFVNNPKAQQSPSRKYLGRPVEEDYAERLDQDELLLAQIQSNYIR